MSAGAGGDRIEVSLGGYARSWRAVIDLERGTIVREGDLGEVGEQSVPTAKLEALRACARSAHERGDQDVREQFATGGATFRLTLDGKTVTLTFATEGGGYYERVQAIFDFVDP